MDRGQPKLSQLAVPSGADVWERCGFSVSGRAVNVGSTSIVLGTAEVSWAFAGGPAVELNLDGIRTSRAEVAAGSTVHPNGALGLDHVVVLSSRPAHTRTVFEEFGLKARGARVRAGKGPDRSESFFWAGDVLIELVGPVEDSRDSDAKAKVWGVTFVVDDIGALQAVPGLRASAPRPAVQQGRLISTVSAEVRLGLAVAFMTPHVRTTK